MGIIRKYPNVAKNRTFADFQMPISAKLFKIETWLFYLYICFRPQGMRWNSQNFHQINILHSRGVFNFTPKYWGKVERFWVPINGHMPTYMKKFFFPKMYLWKVSLSLGLGLWHFILAQVIGQNVVKTVQISPIWG